MSQDMNVVNLIGRLTKDPELRSTPGGLSVTTLRVAFSSSRKTAGGDWEDKSNFVDVTVFGKQADSVARYLAKGSQLGVTGRLDFQEWESDAGKRSKLVVIADRVQFLGARGDEQLADVPGSDEQYARRGEAIAARQMGDEDDIPF